MNNAGSNVHSLTAVSGVKEGKPIHIDLPHNKGWRGRSTPELEMSSCPFLLHSVQARTQLGLTDAQVVNQIIWTIS